MKKILQKSLSQLRALLILAVMFVAGGSAAWAQDGFTLVEISGTGLTVPYGNGNPFNPVTVNGVTISGTGWSSTINIYGGHPLTISCPDYDIRRIELYNYNGWLEQTGCTVNVGTYSAGTWTGTSREVVISSSSDFFVYTVKVYIDPNSGASYADFNYSSQNAGAKGFYTISSDVLSFDAPVTVVKPLKIDGAEAVTATPNGNNLNISFDEIEIPGVHTLTVPKGSLQIGDDYNNEFSVTYTLAQDPTKKFVKFDFSQSYLMYDNNGNVGYLYSGNNPAPGYKFFANDYETSFTYMSEPAARSSWLRNNNGYRLHLGQNVEFKITAPEGYELTKLVFKTDEDGLNLAWVKGLNNSNNMIQTWTGNAESVDFRCSYNTRIQTIDVVCTKLADVTYNVSIFKDTDPADNDWTVTVNGVDGTFKDGDSFSTGKAIQTTDVNAPHHDGYHEAEVSIYEMAGEKYIDVTYAVFDPINYTVNFVNAPVGAEVTLDDQTLTASNNTYEVAKELDESDLVVVDPAGYWTETSFDGTSTFTVTYHAYNYYNVSVSGAAGGALVYDEVEYTGGQIESKDALTLDDVEAKNVANYDADITFDGSTFAVTYTAYPTLAIGANATDAKGNYWTTFSFRHPVSFPDGVTPCIVTGAENGVLTVQEFEKVNNEVSTTLDFMNGTVFENASRLFDESGNAADVTVVRSGGRIESQYLGLYYSSYPTLTITSNGTEPISKIIVTPWGYGSGYCCSLNGGEIVDVPNDPYTFNVNASSCTLAFTPREGSSIYVTKIEIVVGSETIPVIPANTGILVKADEAKANIAYTVHEVGEVNTDVSANLLVAGCTTPSYGWDNANKLYYKLAWASSAYDNLGFYWGVDGGHSITPNANKAYLVLDAAAASNFRAFTFDGNDTITAIESINAEADNAPVYNLQGQRVNVAKAGIYVKNGRKFIVK